MYEFHFRFFFSLFFHVWLPVRGNGRYRDPCSASIDEDDLHTTKLIGDPQKRVRFILIMMNLCVAIQISDLCRDCWKCRLPTSDLLALNLNWIWTEIEMALGFKWFCGSCNNRDIEKIALYFSSEIRIQTNKSCA